MTTPISFHNCTAQGLVLGELEPSWPFLPPCKSSALLGTHLQRAPVKKKHSGMSHLSQEGGRVYAKDKPPCSSEAFTISLCHRNANFRGESGSGTGSVVPGYWKGTVLARSTAVVTTEPQKRKMQYSVCLLPFSFTAVATEAQ